MILLFPWNEKQKKNKCFMSVCTLQLLWSHNDLFNFPMFSCRSCCRRRVEKKNSDLLPIYVWMSHILFKKAHGMRNCMSICLVIYAHLTSTILPSSTNDNSHKFYVSIYTHTSQQQHRNYAQMPQHTITMPSNQFSFRALFRKYLWN